MPYTHKETFSIGNEHSMHLVIHLMFDLAPQAHYTPLRSSEPILINNVYTSGERETYL